MGGGLYRTEGSPGVRCSLPAVIKQVSCCGARKNSRILRMLYFFDRCHSLTSLLPPPAALGSLPTGLSHLIFEPRRAYQKSRYPDRWLARGSLKYCGQPVFELVARNSPLDCSIRSSSPGRPNKNRKHHLVFPVFGGSPGARTLDPRLKRALLYQLS